MDPQQNNNPYTPPPTPGPTPGASPASPTYQSPTTPAPLQTGQPFANSPVVQPPQAQTNPVTPPSVAATSLAAGPATTGTPPTPSASKPATPPPPKNAQHAWRSILSTISLFIFAPLIAWMIVSFGIQSYQVDGVSMEQTLQDKDRLIVNKLPRSMARITHRKYIPHRGDIIIFNAVNLPDTFGLGSKQLIKRVIGLPGDHVVVRDGSITVFNADHPKGFNPDKTIGYTIAAKITDNNVDLKLGPDEIFVCGDNRPNSEDSRYFGPISSRDIVGKLVLRLFPTDKAQRF